MESPQCLEDLPEATVTQDLCLPSRELVASHIKSLAKKTGIKNVFVASDTNPNIPDLEERLGHKVCASMCAWYLDTLCLVWSSYLQIWSIVASA